MKRKGRRDTGGERPPERRYLIVCRKLETVEKLKVLIAEDDAALHELYRAGLNGDLYDLRFALNGNEALEEWASWKPDVVLLDIMMPIMSGFVALKEIRRREKGTGRVTPVIVSTSLSDKRDVIDCVKVGIQGYLVKPVKYTELAEKIESCAIRL